MTEWLIIGGGVQGTYLSNLLISEAGIAADSVRVLDPHEKPMASWTRNSRNCGMRYLRSPSAHNIDIGILSLYRYANSIEGSRYADFIPPYFRPSLRLFQQHCGWTIRRRGLAQLRIKGRAIGLRKVNGALEVSTESGSLSTRNVVLATGLSEQPLWPAWADAVRKEGGKIYHVFDPDFSRDKLSRSATTCVVGGGSSAIQTALALTAQLLTPVTLLSRHTIRKNNLDFDPCWIGPKCLKPFQRVEYTKRRPMVDAARNPGTVPEEVAAELSTALLAGRIDFVCADILGARLRNDRIELNLNTGCSLQAQQMVLATGFNSSRPGGRFIDHIAQKLDLRRSSCGYPVIEDDLRWAENIFVIGPLAELYLGPAARNIAGARNAGRNLLKYLKQR